MARPDAPSGMLRRGRAALRSVVMANPWRARLLGLLLMLPAGVGFGLLIRYGKRGGDVRNASGSWGDNLGAAAFILAIMVAWGGIFLIKGSFAKRR